LRTVDFDYDLPKEFIAQKPIEPRHNSKLLVFDRNREIISHSYFFELKKFLRPDDILVINKSRVIPARLFARKSTGGKVELLLLKKLSDAQWEVLVGGKGIKKGLQLFILPEIHAVIQEELDGSKRIMDFNRPIETVLNQIGEMPLPPYIHEKLDDAERYQTIYAEQPGSAAAPTAGLHFSDELLKDLIGFGIEFVEVLLHIGLDTFLPVKENNIEDHPIHQEWCLLDTQSSKFLNQAKIDRRRIIAVGTTTARVLESSAREEYGQFLTTPIHGFTSLFITPGYQFKFIDGLITNFHLPRSTLLMLVSAFMGLDNVKRCYSVAMSENYRFYSFGDAMLIL